MKIKNSEHGGAKSYIKNNIEITSEFEMIEYQKQ